MIDWGNFAHAVGGIVVGVILGCMWVWDWLRVARKQLDAANEHLNTSRKRYEYAAKMEDNARQHLRDARAVLYLAQQTKG